MVPILTQKLGSDDGWVRWTAVSVLGSMRDKGAIGPLVAMLNDRFRDGQGRYAVRIAASQALKVISDHDFGQDYRSWRDWSEKQSM